MNEMPDWVARFPGAVTITDADLRIVFLNQQAARTFADYGGEELIGADLLACHGERSRAQIEGLLRDAGTNVYTIEKRGLRKLIYQTVWRDRQGAVGGLVELSLELPASMPHFVRD
jgi:PAS domain-containing protein